MTTLRAKPSASRRIPASSLAAADAGLSTAEIATFVEATARPEISMLTALARLASNDGARREEDAAEVVLVFEGMMRSNRELYSLLLQRSSRDPVRSRLNELMKEYGMSALDIIKAEIIAETKSEGRAEALLRVLALEMPSAQPDDTPLDAFARRGAYWVLVAQPARLSYQRLFELGVQGYGGVAAAVDVTARKELADPAARYTLFESVEREEKSNTFLGRVRARLARRAIDEGDVKLVAHLAVIAMDEAHPFADEAFNALCMGPFDAQRTPRGGDELTLGAFLAELPKDGEVEALSLLTGEGGRSKRFSPSVMWNLSFDFLVGASLSFRALPRSERGSSRDFFRSSS